MAVAVEALPAAAEAAEGAGAAAEGAAGAGGAGGSGTGAKAGRTEGRVWQAASSASGQLRRAPAAARSAASRVSSPSALSATLTKLIWAVAIGLIVLQVAAEATGQQWNFHLPGLASPRPKVPYLPLYAGQQLPGANSAVPIPGLPIQTWTGPANQPATLPLSNRSAGNQGVQ
jgi:hypothetical protein